MKNTKTALYNLDFFLKLLHYVAIKAKYTSIEDKRRVLPCFCAIRVGKISQQI